MTLVCPQSTAELAVLPALTPVAEAVGQVLFEQQLHALEEVASLQSRVAAISGAALPPDPPERPLRELARSA